MFSSVCTEEGTSECCLCGGVHTPLDRGSFSTLINKIMVHEYAGMAGMVYSVFNSGQVKCVKIMGTSS